MNFDISSNIFTQTVVLSSDTANYSLNGYAPMRLFINPNITTADKVRSIKYVWEENKEIVVNYNPSAAYDDGNPIYYPQSYDFFIKDKKITQKTKKIEVFVYFFKTSIPLSFTINLNLEKPSFSDFFESVKLIKTRMFGPNNTILYVFETKNPDYILMSTVNWEIVPEQIITEMLPPVRYYQFLPSFENRFSTSIPANSAIQNIISKNNDIRIENVYDNGGELTNPIVLSGGNNP